MNISTTRLRQPWHLGALILTGTATLAGCASTPPAPTAALQAAQQAITTAERGDGPRLASGELAEARAKLAAANTAVSAKQMVSAAQLAEQSRVEAELASARTAAIQAQTVNADTTRGTDTLIEEMQRNNGAAK